MREKRLSEVRTRKSGSFSLRFRRPFDPTTDREYWNSIHEVKSDIRGIVGPSIPMRSLPLPSGKGHHIGRPGYHYEAPPVLEPLFGGFSLPLDIPKEAIRAVARVLGNWVTRKKDYVLELESKFNGVTRIRVQGFNPNDCIAVITRFFEEGRKHARLIARGRTKPRKRRRKKRRKRKKKT